MRVYKAMPLLLLVAVSSTALLANPQKQAEKDEKWIVGTWVMVSGEKEGR
jgi:hypothetical protein